MSLLKKILDNIFVIISILYLWLLPILLFYGLTTYKAHDIPFAILALGIYLGDKIDNLKAK